MLAPFVLNGWALTQLDLYMSYGILAMALAFIWGQAGIMSFGQAVFFGLGGYCMGLVTLGRLPVLGDSTFMGLVLCILLTFVVSLILGRLLFHGRGLAGAYFAIVTLCGAVVVEALAQQWSFIGGFDGLLGIPPWVGFWHDDADPYLSTTEVYFLMLGIAFLAFLGLSFIIRSPIGTVLAAIRDNEERTAFFGYDIVRYKVGGVYDFSGGIRCGRRPIREAIRICGALTDWPRPFNGGSHLGSGRGKECAACRISRCTCCSLGRGCAVRATWILLDSTTRYLIYCNRCFYAFRYIWAHPEACAAKTSYSRMNDFPAD